MKQICQSCAMEMVKTEDYGTHANGTPNEVYCIHCFQDGKFTQNLTMDEQIEQNLQSLAEFNKESGTNFSAEQARAEMQNYFPTLKRWLKQCK